MTPATATPRARSAPDGAAAWVRPLVLAAAGALCYLNSFRAPMFFDDLPAIVNNTTIRSLWPLWRAFWGPDETGVSGRPFLNFTFALNYALSGLDVWSYHLFNLAIHVAAGLAVSALVRAVWGAARLAAPTRLDPASAGFAAALLWMLHPIQTGAVTFIIIRNESLMGLFYILTAHALVRSIASPGLRWQVLGAVWGLLGMASKETMITAPLVMLMLDWVLSREPLPVILSRRRVFYGGMILLWILGAVLILTGPRQRTTGFSLEHVAPLDYLRTQSRVLSHYLRLLAWPFPLVLDYEWPLERGWWPSALFTALLGGAFLATAWGVARRRLWSLPAGAFFLVLAPTSSLMPVSEAAWEYRVYIPSVGLAAALVAWLAPRLRSVGLPRGIPVLLRPAGLLALAAGVLGLLTLARNHDFRAESAILQDNLFKRPANARVCSNLAAAVEKADPALALELYTRAVALNPTYAKYQYNLGTALVNLGHHERAVAPLAEAVRLRPDFVPARHNLAGVWFHLGRIDDARREFEAALALDPSSPDIRFNYAVVLLKSGDTPGAIREFRETLRLQSGNPSAIEALRQLGVDPAGP